MTSIDEKFLRPGRPAEVEGELTAAKHRDRNQGLDSQVELDQAGDEEQLDEDIEEEDEEEEEDNMASVKREAINGAEPKKLVVPQKSLSAATSKILVSAWTNIIPSFGLSFFYIYIHLFLKNIFGERLFAPLGLEWFDKPGGFMAKRDRLGEKLRLPEMMAVLMITLILFFAFIFLLSILALLLEVIENPLSTLVKVLWS